MPTICDTVGIHLVAIKNAMIRETRFKSGVVLWFHIGILIACVLPRRSLLRVVLRRSLVLHFDWVVTTVIK